MSFSKQLLYPFQVTGYVYVSSLYACTTSLTYIVDSIDYNTGAVSPYTLEIMTARQTACITLFLVVPIYGNVWKN